MNGLIDLLILFAVLAVVWYVFSWLCSYLGAPDPVVKVVTVVLVLVFLIAVVGLLTGAGPGANWRFR